MPPQVSALPSEMTQRGESQVNHSNSLHQHIPLHRQLKAKETSVYQFCIIIQHDRTRKIKVKSSLLLRCELSSTQHDKYILAPPEEFFAYYLSNAGKTRYFQCPHIVPYLVLRVWLSQVVRNMHTHRYGPISARFLAHIHRSRMKLTFKFLKLVLLARKTLLRDTAHLLIFQTYQSFYSFFYHLL